MSQCDSETKNQVESMKKFLNLEKNIDSIGLLNLIKKLVYTGGTDNLHTRHNEAMAHINLMNLHQDRFQSVKEFRDQYLAKKKVLDYSNCNWKMQK